MDTMIGWIALAILTPCLTAPDVVVTVDARATPTSINPLLYGNNIHCWGGGGEALWNAERQRLHPELLEQVKRLGPTVLRFPGGGKASHYHWEQAVGPERGKSERDPERRSSPRYQFGTNEFMLLCREVGAEPLLTVNWATGNPGEAARWVEYCNGGVATRQGALRAEHGHPEPYGVKYWEIGNECYSAAQVTEYALSLRAWSRAMKAVDPTIRIGAVGWAWPGWKNHYHPDTKAWNETLIDLAGDEYDALIVHPYCWLTKEPQPEDRNAEFVRAVLAYPRQMAADLRRVRQTLDDSGLSEVELWATEWNGYYGKLGMGPELVQVINGLLNAGQLMAFLREGVPLATYWELCTSGWGHFSSIMFLNNERLAYRPSFHILRLFREQLGSGLIPCEVSCDTYANQPLPVVRAAEDNPVVEAIAGVNEKNNTLCVMLLNKTERRQMARIDVRGTQAETARVRMFGGDDPFSSQLELRELEVASTSPVTVTLLPFSLAAIEIHTAAP